MQALRPRRGRKTRFTRERVPDAAAEQARPGRHRRHSPQRFARHAAVPNQRKEAESMVRLIASFAFAIFVGCQVAAGEGAKIEPKADDVLRQMSELLAGTKSFSFKAHSAIEQVMES